jgi:hypothetical protein
LPEEDKEFGYKEWVNTELGESINCGNLGEISRKV